MQAQAAWRRHCLPQLRRRFDPRLASGRAASATDPSQSRRSSGAAAGGGTPPKPRAGGGWGHPPRRSHRLERNATADVGPAAAPARPAFAPSLDGDGLRALERSMGDAGNESAPSAPPPGWKPTGDDARNNHRPTRQNDRPPASAPPPDRPDRRFSQNGPNFISKYSRKKDPRLAEMHARFNGCHSIDHAVRLAHEFYLENNLPPHLTAALWKKISSLMGNKSWNNGVNTARVDDAQLNRLLDHLFRHTVNEMEEFSHADLSYLAQATASIAKFVKNQGSRHHNYHHRNTLYNMLIKDGVPYWNQLQERALEHMDSFRPKWLVSVAWAFATVSSPLARDARSGNNYVANALDVSPFFRALHESFDRRKGEFSSKHMGNLAWAAMTCRQELPMLFCDFSNEFVLRRERESRHTDELDMMNHLDRAHDVLDPMTLCQWANAFAKAGHEDERLFQSIAEAAAPRLREFDPRHFSNLAYACALAGVLPALEDGSSLFDRIAVSAVPRASNFAPQHVANILWAYAKMDHASPELFDALARGATPRLADFSAQLIANLAWALSKQPPACSEDVFDGIAEAVASRGSLDSFTSQGLAMLAHSFATVGHVTNSRFWDSVDRAATSRASELAPLECSQIAWSFATVGRLCQLQEDLAPRRQRLFRGIESVVMSEMHCIKPQGLSNIAWAFATLDYDSPTLFDAIARESLRRLDEFSYQDRVMLALAYSRLGRPYTELFDRIASGSASQLGNFSGLHLFNLVMSYTKAGHQSEPWMKSVADEIVRRPSNSFPPHLIVGIAWAYSSSGFRIPALFNSLSDGCIHYCDKLQAKEVASLAWSFTSIDYFHRPLLAALAASSEERWRDFDAASLANMAWAYATAQEDRPRLFEGIADAAVLRSDEFASQGVSMLLWACAASGHSDRWLFNALAPRATELLSECNGQSLATIAWAYAVADVDADSLFGAEFVRVVSEKSAEFDRQGFGQLHQWNIWRKAMAADAVLPPVLEKRCRDEFSGQPMQASKMQKGVMSELASMGVSHEEEFHTPSGYRLDAMVWGGGKLLGVEVDGPHHFVDRRPTGATLLKRRQLSEVDGIEVVSVPYWEWNEVEYSGERRGYLRAKLGIAMESMD